MAPTLAVQETIETISPLWSEVMEVFVSGEDLQVVDVTSSFRCELGFWVTEIVKMELVGVSHLQMVEVPYSSIFYEIDAAIR